MSESEGRRGAKESASWKAVGRIAARFLRPRRSVMALALLGLLCQAALNLPVPVMQGLIIDRLAGSDGRSDAWFVPLWASWQVVVGILMLMIACHFGRMVVGWLTATTMSRLTLEVVREMTDALHQKIQRLPISYFEREPTGHIMARMTSDVGSLLLFLNGGALQLISDLVLACGVLGVLVWVDWRLALMGLVVVPMFMMNHRWFSGSVHELSGALREQISEIYAYLSDRIPAVRVVRSCANEDVELAELAHRLDKQRALQRRSVRMVARQGAWSILINGLGMVAVFLAGGTLVDRGTLTVGELVAFASLLALLYQPMVRLTGAQAMISATVVAVDRIVELLEEPELVIERTGARLAGRSKGNLVYRNVSFAYAPGGRSVLGEIDLAVEPGMTVGIMGMSGSGKSTLLALAPRLYELPKGDGSIWLDGQDVRGIDIGDLRRAVSLVPQHPVLFEGTLRSNLTYARPGADARAIWRALEMMELAEWVAQQPKGLDTIVGQRGQTLSGGQRQRLALARAMIADPPLLMLDDATSAVDRETESRIQAALGEFLMDRSCLIVSHKVVSVRDADWILVLDQGMVVEEGSHGQLVRSGGLYARMYEQQTGWGRVRELV